MERRGRVGAVSRKVLPQKGFSGMNSEGLEGRTSAKTYEMQAGIASSSRETFAKATNIENQLRYALLRKGILFIEQASVGPWSLDFLIPEHNIVIEADGEFWHNNMKTRMKDRRKDAWLKAKGYTVFHFAGKEITSNADYCVEKILKSLRAITSTIQDTIEEDDDYDTEDSNVAQENLVRLTQDEEYERWTKGSL